MSMRSITFRLAAWCAGISLLVCIGFGLYTYFGLRYYLRRAQTDTLQRRAQQVAAIVNAHIGHEGDVFTIELIKTSYAPEHNDRFIRIRRPDGSLLYVSGPPSDQSFDPETVPMLPLAADGKNRRAVVQGNLLLVQTSTKNSSGHYLIDCGASKLPGERVLHGFLAVLGFGVPLMVAVAIAGGAALVRRALNPVRDITDAAREITSYNLGRRLPVVRSKDELEGLSVVLNQMIGRLDEAFQHARRFTADASHELRTPLTIMRVELESIAQESGLDPATREKAASVLEETERLAKTVEGLFAISRLEAGEALMDVTRFDLAELVVSTAEQMSLLADEKHLTVQSRGCEAVEVSGDRFRLKQVIVNLLDNAIKYSPERGEITLATRAVDGRAMLEVADSGEGIPADALEQVFNRFFRADSVRTHSESGAGLGLSIVRSICQAHGGSVEATNRPEGGCRITVQLPLNKPSSRMGTLPLASASASAHERPSSLTTLRSARA
ncbi:MAG: HAMP domain-containing protein [Rhodospirillales bacterium]|nr:HAMP domain-containing protein [Acetobacter sp.]